MGELNLSFALYSALHWLLLPTHGEEDFGFWQAALVLAALAWDIASSGGVATNKDTTVFPRIARVSMFFAYIVTVALFVLLSRSGSLAGSGIGFDSEAIIGGGIVLFGAPFFLFVFGLRMRLALPREASVPQGAAAVPATS